MSTEVAKPVAATSQAATQPKGMRKNGMKSPFAAYNMQLMANVEAGKQWHETKSAFRPKAGASSWEKRNAERVATAAVKAKEKEMKDEKEAERQVRRQ